MIKTRTKTITEEYAVCDFCGEEIEIQYALRGICYCIETCSHCGKHICEKHWNDCEFGEGEDSWSLCPNCSKLVKFEDYYHSENGIPYCCHLPIVIETGKEMELPYW